MRAFYVVFGLLGYAIHLTWILLTPRKCIFVWFFYFGDDDRNIDHNQSTRLNESWCWNAMTFFAFLNDSLNISCLWFCSTGIVLQCTRTYSVGRIMWRCVIDCTLFYNVYNLSLGPFFGLDCCHCTICIYLCSFVSVSLFFVLPFAMFLSLGAFVALHTIELKQIPRNLCPILFT